MPAHVTRQIKTRGYRRDTLGLLRTGWPTHLVLLSGADGWERLPSELVAALRDVDDSRSLRLTFDDTVRPKDQYAPTIRDIDTIVAFAESMPTECRLLSVCPGGFARSAAASWISWIVWGDTPGEGLEKVLADRHVASPNRLMVALADVAMGLCGELWTTYSSWMVETVGVRYDPPVPLRGKAAARLREGPQGGHDR